jgi:hypothetical protein
MSPLNPDKALIFRIVHRDNLPWILDHGFHSQNSLTRDPNFRSIGNPDLIQKRTTRIVNVGPGGTLSDYVPFYFTPFSIMMYNIYTGFGVARIPNEEILIFTSSLLKVSELGIPFVFTDQHAYTMMANYYTDLRDLNAVNWELLNSRDFRHDPDDPGKKEQYQAEALVWKHLPLDALLGICSFSAEVDGAIKAQLALRRLNLQTIVKRDWYFG